MCFFKDSLLIGSLTKELFCPITLLFQFTGESEQEECRSFPGCFFVECFLVYSPVLVIFSEDLLFLDNVSSFLWLPFPEITSGEGERALTMDSSKDSCRCSVTWTPKLSLEVSKVSWVETGTCKESSGKGILASPVIFWNWREKQKQQKFSNEQSQPLKHRVQNFNVILWPYYYNSQLIIQKIFRPSFFFSYLYLAKLIPNLTSLCPRLYPLYFQIFCLR